MKNRKSVKHKIIPINLDIFRMTNIKIVILIIKKMLNKQLLFTSALIILSFGLTNASEKAKIENGVMILTDQNFDEIVPNYEYMIVEFFAPWW